MAYYFATEVLLIFIAFIFPPRKRHTKNMILRREGCKASGGAAYTFFAAVILSAFMGLRNDFAQDYANYVYLFEKNAKQTVREVIIDNDYTELGYRLLNKFVSLISPQPIALMLVVALIFVFLILLEGRSEVSNMLIYVLLFVNVGIYFLTFNMMRQGLAAAILYCGTKYLRNDEKWKYVVVVLLASTIHTTALAMLLAVPFLTRKICKKNIFQITCLGILVTIFLPQIILLVQQYRYSDYVYGMQAAHNLNGVIVQWSVFIFSVYVTMTGKVDYKSVNGKIVINGSIFFMITSVLSLRVNQLSRITYFFSPYLMAYGTNAIDAFAKQRNRAIKPLIVMLLITYMWVWLHDESYAQYKFFWQL